MRRSPAIPLIALLAALLAGCAAYELDKSPPFYESMARPDAEVNVNAAASMLSDYRRTFGLPAVQVDSALVAIARDQAKRMAAADKLTHDPGGRGFTQRLAAGSYDAARAAENIGAGYHTLAEAFSGWRDSPSHNKNMLLPGATRVGIATAYAPHSKYKVFWALILAEPAN
ncbi:MAG: CAP domain-containing protein [Bradyrhizobiaceae bacterium]|nr:CAP domain-containing protein [Bradyrhizobiaceae bacterium]